MSVERMSEYIISVPDRHDACFECQRDTCIEVGCEYARSITARYCEEIVRCEYCQFFEMLGFTNGWDYYCVRGGVVRKVSKKGFCAWGERVSDNL